MKTFSEIVQDITNAILARRSDIDVKPGSVISDILIEPTAEEAEKIYYRIYNIILSLSVLTAKGAQLDTLAANVGLFRITATKATGIVTFSRTTPDPSNDYPIPLGTRVSTVGYYGQPPIYFKTTQTATLLHGQSSVDVAVECEQGGTIGNVQAHKITVITTPVNGINSVDNANAFTNGIDTETDDTFRNRIISTALGNDAGTEAALKKIALETAGVQSVFLALASGTTPASRGIGKVDIYIKGQNLQSAIDLILYTGATTSRLVFQPATDITLVTGTKSGSPYTFIEGTDYEMNIETDDRSIVYQVLKWLSGSRPDMDTLVTVNYTYDKLVRDVQLASEAKRWVTMDLWIRRSTATPIDVTATVVVYPDFDATTVKNQVKTAITDYINGLGLGEPVQKADLVFVAKSISGVDNFTLTLPANDISINGDHYASAGTITIS